MKHAIFGLLAAVAIASGSGCCCLDRMMGWGGCGGCGQCGGGCPLFGKHCCDDGCGGGCNECGSGGCDSCGGGGCDSCGDGGYGGHGYAEGDGYAHGGCKNCGPSGGHPLVHHHRNSGGQYEPAPGPPTGQVAYPYYTNRGPRDFLAKNPRGIGP